MISIVTGAFVDACLSWLVLLFADIVGRESCENTTSDLCRILTALSCIFEQNYFHGGNCLNDTCFDIVGWAARSVAASFILIRSFVHGCVLMCASVMSSTSADAGEGSSAGASASGQQPVMFGGNSFNDNFTTATASSLLHFIGHCPG